MVTVQKRPERRNEFTWPLGLDGKPLDAIPISANSTLFSPDSEGALDEGGNMLRGGYFLRRAARVLNTTPEDVIELAREYWIPRHERNGMDFLWASEVDILYSMLYGQA